MEQGDTIEVENDVVSQALSTLADLSLTIEVVRYKLSSSPTILHPLTPPSTQTEVAKMSAEAATILYGLGFSQELIDGPFTTLSGGWKSRCSLAGSLLIQSDVLLLDEPSNFLVSTLPVA